jgi:uncharacterized protein (TIGR03086 family)
MFAVMSESLELLRSAGAAVSESNKDASTPCANWTVTQVLQHAAGDQLAWAAALGTGAGPGYDPFDPSGIMTGGPSELVAPAIAAAETAWSSIADDGPSVPTPLPQGAMPAATAAAACALDAAVHAWDIAVAVGLPSPLTDELAVQLSPAAQQIVELLRQYGAYGPALPPEEGDGAAAELLRYLGRNPLWQR